MNILSKIESILTGFFIYRGYLLVIAIIIFFVAYGVLIHWRPHATEGLFSIEWLNTTQEK